MTHKPWIQRFWKALWDKRALILIGTVVFALTRIFHIGCIPRYITGIPCPGCGATRAYFALLRLDFAAAFALHPLFPVLIPGVLFLIFGKQPLFGSLKRQRIFCCTFLALICGCWFIRVFVVSNNGFDVDFTRSIIYKLFYILSGHFSNE